MQDRNQAIQVELCAALVTSTNLKLLINYLFFKEMYALATNFDRLQTAVKNLGYLKYKEEPIRLDDALGNDLFDISFKDVRISKDEIVVTSKAEVTLHNSILEDQPYNDRFNLIQKIVLKTLNWAPLVAIQQLFNRNFDSENPSQIQKNLFNIGFIYRLVVEDEVTYLSTVMPKLNVFYDETCIELSTDFFTYLHRKVVSMHQTLKTKGLIDSSGNPSKSADETWAFATELFHLMDELENKDLNDLEKNALAYITNKAKHEEQDLTSLQNLLSAIRFLTLIHTKDSNDLDHADCLDFLRTINDKALRHEMLAVLFARFYNSAQPDEKTLHGTSEALYRSLTSPTQLNGFGLKAAACRVMYDIDDLFLDPKTPVPHDKLINALTATNDIVNKSNFANIINLGKVAADIGHYPKGKILSRSLIIVGGLGLVALGIGIAMGCPPLGIITTALGGLILASCAVGGAGLIVSGLGLYAVKRAAHKESASIDATITAAKQLPSYTN